MNIYSVSYAYNCIVALRYLIQSNRSVVAFDGGLGGKSHEKIK